MFLNLLVLIMTFVENKFKVRDVTNRQILLEEIFCNLSYTIVISLIALGFLVFLCVQLLPSEWVENPVWNHNACYFKTKQLLHIQKLTANNVVAGVLSLSMYFFVAKVMLTLLMIIKRIFKLFDHEIVAADTLNKQEMEEKSVSYD